MERLADLPLLVNGQKKEKLSIPEPILFDLWLENKFTQT